MKFCTRMVKEKMDVWQIGLTSKEIAIPKGNIKEIILDTNTPEAFYENNSIAF